MGRIEITDRTLTTDQADAIDAWEATDARLRRNLIVILAAAVVGADGETRQAAKRAAWLLEACGSWRPRREGSYVPSR